MSRREMPKELVKGIVNVNFEKFKQISEDFIDASEKGHFRLILAGPRMSARVGKATRRMLGEKHKISENKFNETVTAFFYCMHFILRKEEEDQLRKIKSEKDAVEFKRKLDFTRELLAKHPQIEQDYFLRTACITNTLENFEWDVNLKYAHSLTDIGEMFPPFPYGEIQLILREYLYRSEPKKTEIKTIEFAVSQQDLDYLLKSLEALRDALKSLQAKKLQ